MKLHGMLSTLSYMRHWRPELYPTDECQVCEQEQKDTRQQKCNEAVPNVNSVGWRTWKKVKNIWAGEVKKADEKDATLRVEPTDVPRGR